MIEFYKYEGAGNDFILIDDRAGVFPLNDHSLIQKMCDRHFGIGADGLMLLQKDAETDFKMVYYNSDGNYSSMCGNGGRCITRFALDLGLEGPDLRFMAVDGLHHAMLLDADQVELEMIDVEHVEELSDGALLLDTGSPHFIKQVEDLQGMDIVKEGRKIRNSDRFIERGVNVNFIELNGDQIVIRTYERGVEGETLACGTGVTAAAIAADYWGKKYSPIAVKAMGGNLSVRFDRDGGAYRNVWKTGPAKFVFKGFYPV